MFYFLILLIVCCANAEFTGRFNDYMNHTCIRDCTTSKGPMVCNYDWTLESYATYSRHCYSCRKNITDCYREGCLTGDGTQRVVDVINRLLPGPSVQVCEGDTVVVNVQNRARSEKVTSVHWHGIRQRGSQDMDGPTMITQCPIIPRSNFVYKFVAEDPGTHFWHSHNGVQRADGVFGAVIVRQSKNKDVHGSLYDYDLKEHVIILNDWTKEYYDTSYTHYLFSDLYKDIDSILINGKGIAAKNQGKNVPLAQFKVKPNARYRFRLIDAGVNSCPMVFSIDGHNLTLIASDGFPIDPVEVESVVASPGERYDFILNTNQKVQKYWIKVRGEGNCAFKDLFQRAVLEYEGATNTLDSKVNLTYGDSQRIGKAFRSVPSKDDNQTYFHIADARNANSPPVTAGFDYYQRLAQKPDKKFYLTLDAERVYNPEFNERNLMPVVDGSFYTPQINNITFSRPSFPALYNWDKIPVDFVCNSETKNRTCKSTDPTFDCECFHTLKVKLNDLVEFVVIDEATLFESHVLHLHGHSFAFLGSEKLTLDENDIFDIKNLKTETVLELEKKGKLKRNFDRPVIKDSLVMPTAGYAVIRFIADNPGTWLFHCHLDIHSDSGMMLVVKVGEDSDLPPKTRASSTCANY